VGAGVGVGRGRGSCVCCGGGLWRRVFCDLLVVLFLGGDCFCGVWRVGVLCGDRAVGLGGVAGWWRGSSGFFRGGAGGGGRGGGGGFEGPVGVRMFVCFFGGGVGWRGAVGLCFLGVEVVFGVFVRGGGRCSRRSRGGGGRWGRGGGGGVAGGRAGGVVGIGFVCLGGG